MLKYPIILNRKKYLDERGYLTEIVESRFIKKNKLKKILLTSSKKNVIRGFHFQKKKTN